MEIKDNLSEDEMDKQIEKLLHNTDYMCWLVSFMNTRLQKSLAFLEIASNFMYSANYSTTCDRLQGKAIASAIKEMLEEEHKFNES